MNIRFGSLKTFSLMMFFGLLLQGCGSKNHAPFHVYSSVRVETTRSPLLTNAIESGISEVRVAAIGIPNQRK